MENSCRSYFHSDCTHRNITLCTKHQQIVQKDSYDKEELSSNGQHLNLKETIVKPYEQDKSSSQGILLKYLEEENLFLKRERLKWINSSKESIQDLNNKLKESERNYAELLQDFQEASEKLQRLNDLESEILVTRKEHAQLLDSYNKLQSKNPREENYSELLQAFKEAKRKLEKTKDLESEIQTLRKEHTQLLDSYKKLQNKLNFIQEESDKEKTHASKPNPKNSLLIQLESRVAHLERETLTHRHISNSISHRMSETIDYVKQHSPNRIQKHNPKANKSSLKAFGNGNEKSPKRERRSFASTKSPQGNERSSSRRDRSSTKDLDLLWKERSPTYKEKHLNRKEGSPQRRDESSYKYSTTPVRSKAHLSVDFANVHKSKESEDLKTTSRKLSQFDKSNFCSTCFFTHNHHWVRPQC